MIVESSATTPSSASNNPWQPAEHPSDEEPAPLSGPKSEEKFEDNSVEDNFVAPADVDDVGVAKVDKPFEKLPDSEEYLAALERKLKKLTNPKNQEKSLLKSLTERRSDEARRYLVTNLLVFPSYEFPFFRSYFLEITTSFSAKL